MLSDQEINDVIGNDDSDFATKVQTLVDKANDSGGNDNITVQLIEFMAPYGVIPAAPKRKVEPVANSGAGEGNKKSLLPTIIVCVVVLLLSALALWWFYSNGMTDDNNDILAADEPKVEVSVSKDNDDNEVLAETTEEAKPAAEESKVVAVAETNKKAVQETKKTIEEKPAPTPVVKAQPAEVKSEPVVEETSASGESEDTFDPSSLDEGL
jgi:flagellar basal body-associated protein FliL